jgi:hypothetical protein
VSGASFITTTSDPAGKHCGPPSWWVGGVGGLGVFGRAGQGPWSSLVQWGGLVQWTRVGCLRAEAKGCFDSAVGTCLPES